MVVLKTVQKQNPLRIKIVFKFYQKRLHHVCISYPHVSNTVQLSGDYQYQSITWKRSAGVCPGKRSGGTGAKEFFYRNEN